MFLYGYDYLTTTKFCRNIPFLYGNNTTLKVHNRLNKIKIIKLLGDPSSKTIYQQYYLIICELLFVVTSVSLFCYTTMHVNYQTEKDSSLISSDASKVDKTKISPA